MKFRGYLINLIHTSNHKHECNICQEKRISGGLTWFKSNLGRISIKQTASVFKYAEAEWMGKGDPKARKWKDEKAAGVVRDEH